MPIVRFAKKCSYIYSNKKVKNMSYLNGSNQDSIELFRYVTFKSLQVIDVWHRIKKAKEFPDIDLLKDKKEDWANNFVKNNISPIYIGDLKFLYFEYLNITELSSNFLPTSSDIKDIKLFKTLDIYNNENYQKDYVNLLAFMMAYKILHKNKELNNISKLFGFIDIFPKLDQIKDTLIFPKPIFKHMKFKISTKKQVSFNVPTQENFSKNEEIKLISDDILLMWQLRNEIKRKQQEEYELEIKNIQHQHFDNIDKLKSSKIIKGEEKPSKISKQDIELQKKHIEFLKKRNTKLSKLREDKIILNKTLTISNMIKMDSNKLVSSTDIITISEIKKIQNRLKDNLNIAVHIGSNNKFCQLYKHAVDTIDKLPSTLPMLISQNCFSENPNIKFEDNIRILGSADLIKVEETLLKYKEGEISHIQNILPRESLSHEVKNTNYHENTYDIYEEESTDDTQKINTTTKQDLSSEVKNEINSRFNSDVNASANASGSGTIGVADLSGGASFQAGLGIGMDSNFSNSNTSKFSQQIINEAITNTKKSVREHRMQRSYTLTETTDLHEFDNSESEDAVNGIYIFLDKEICIKKTIYGKRLFMLANIMLPGNSLICQKNIEKQMKFAELGTKPVFNLSPAEIQPNNYQELVAIYNASGIQPPPSAIKTIVKTYKTDTTNANVEQQEFNVKKIADVLVPFFERYKRFLITDTVTIPDGYQVQEVAVTVNHGKNGISIPAHLPLSLAGASMYAAPNLLTAVPFAGFNLPIVFWQIAYLASPLLHYNTDSSNVTVSIGNESCDSPYFFFPPEELIQEIFSLLGNFLPMSDDVIERIKLKANELINSLSNNAQTMSENLATTIQDDVNVIIETIQNILNLIGEILSGDVDKIPKLLERLKDLELKISLNLGNLMNTEFFEPFKTFIDDVLQIILNGFSSVLGDFFEFLTLISDNTQDFLFPSVSGLQGELPISLNTVSIHPGVTVNLSVCVTRTEEVLEKWRLDTFSKLYQAYLEQSQEYENQKISLMGEKTRKTSLGNMRKEERAVIKDLALRSLNNYHEDNGNQFDFDRINFFENTIDWENMSYKLYSYGPNLNEIRLEKDGLYYNIDDRREAFLKAHWAQVLIPVHEDKNSILEAKVMKYFENGTFNFEDEFEEDELTALYQDLILGRELLGDNSRMTNCKITLPTDLIIVEPDLIKVQPNLSENSEIDCDRSC